MLAGGRGAPNPLSNPLVPAEGWANPSFGPETEDFNAFPPPLCSGDGAVRGALKASLLTLPGVGEPNPSSLPKLPEEVGAEGAAAEGALNASLSEPLSKPLLPKSAATPKPPPFAGAPNPSPKPPEEVEDSNVEAGALNAFPAVLGGLAVGSKLPKLPAVLSNPPNSLPFETAAGWGAAETGGVGTGGVKPLLVSLLVAELGADGGVGAGRFGR